MEYKLVNDINKNIFREYDIRGVYGTDINADIAYTIGRGYGSYIKNMGKSECVVGRDNRYSSPVLSEALIAGIIESGINVVNLGIVTTPMYYYASIKLNVGRGIMVTASHNPKDDNGFKIAFDNNTNAKGKEIEDFYQFILKQDFSEDFGLLSFKDVKDDYINYLINSSKIDNKHIKVAIDCGNGTTSFFAPELYSSIGVDLVLLNSKSDSNFPNHHPDPSVDENMKVLCDAVTELGLDIGIAFDGDGDRVGIVDDKGRIVRIDVLMALIVKYLSNKYPKSKYLYDVKCGLTLINEIEKTGSTGIMTRTGNSYTKELTMKNDCIFGGEYSGHVYFRDKFLGFDDGMYAGLRVLEIMSDTGMKLSDMIDTLDKYYSTPEIKIQVSDDKKFKVIDKIKEELLKNSQEIDETDGIRVNFKDSWALVRTSNTGPNITFRCEAKTEEKKEELKSIFLEMIEKYNK